MQTLAQFDWLINKQNLETDSLALIFWVSGEVLRLQRLPNQTQLLAKPWVKHKRVKVRCLPKMSS